MLDMVLAYYWIPLIVVSLVLIVAAHTLILRAFGVVIIPDNQIGIVKKKFVLIGKNKTLPDGRIVALHGEAGVQADTLAPGLHLWLWPWQYEIDKVGFVCIPEGNIGVVDARDGEPLSGGRVLGKKVSCDAFQSARVFLEGHGERGPQIDIIPPGSYRINTQLFTVSAAPITEVKDNMVGVVTTKEGRSLSTGDIAGKEISGHNMFQDGQSFLDKGGFKGLQEQVILAGRYFINPRFAVVESQPMTSVPIANAGVVIAFVGEDGSDVTGIEFKHGNLVQKGRKGVWVDPLDPGKYPINPLTHKVENVPTANVVLNWATGKSEAHMLDKNLSTITVRSSDGFTFNLDVSQIIHIPRNDAPKVIARFGSVANLVTQVLEPTIGNYFRNAAQDSDVIEFLTSRRERQEEAKKAITEGLLNYGVGAIDTLIGDIVPPESLMKTLTDRKLAEQEKVTFDTQRMAEETRKNLQQARAMADTQANVVASERKVAIAEFDAQSSVKKAEGDAQAKTINAKADAEVLVMIGEAEGRKVTAVGIAEAEVIRKKTEAVGQGNFAMIEIGKALAAAKTKLVPEIVAGGSDGGGTSNLVNLLLTDLLQKQRADKIEIPLSPPKNQ